MLVRHFTISMSVNVKEVFQSTQQIMPSTRVERHPAIIVNNVVFVLLGSKAACNFVLRTASNYYIYTLVSAAGHGSWASLWFDQVRKQVLHLIAVSIANSVTSTNTLIPVTSIDLDIAITISFMRQHPKVSLHGHLAFVSGHMMVSKAQISPPLATYYHRLHGSQGTREILGKELFSMPSTTRLLWSNYWESFGARAAKPCMHIHKNPDILMRICLWDLVFIERCKGRPPGLKTLNEKDIYNGFIANQ